MNNIPSDHPISSNGKFCIDDFEDTFPTGIVGTPETRGGRDARLMVKKVNHNATERDRRKKINSLYSSLRSLLPQTDQSKKLSIPATISRVLKYIPELQAQIQQHSQEKERLLSCATEQKIDDPGEIAGPKVVSMSWISKTEALVQICEGSRAVNGLSGILLDMEMNGLSLTNASSFKSSEGEKIFHDLRVRTVEGSRSPQVAQGGVFPEESSPLFGSEFSWHTTVRQCSNLDDLSNRQACAGTS